MVGRTGFWFSVAFFGVVVFGLATNRLPAEEPAIRYERDYQKYGMPKLDERWSEADHFEALDAARKLAEANPLFLPSSKDGLSYLIFRRLTSPRDLPDSGLAGEIYFTALEKLYLEYGKADPKRFEADFPKIQSGRLRYLYPRLSYTESNAPVANEVYASLMSWSRARFDLKDEQSEIFDRGMKESEFLVVNILKRMPPDFQEKILVKLDAIAARYPEAARNQEITPEFLEKLMIELDIRPQGMSYKMQAAPTPDATRPWGLAELQSAVTTLQRQAEIDKSQLPRLDSKLVQKMLSPATIKAAISDEGGVRQLTGSLKAARVQYINAFTVYRLAGATEYAPEAVSMLRVAHALYWEDLRRFDEWRRTIGSAEEDIVSKQFDGQGLAFCMSLLTDTNMVRTQFPSRYQAEFEAFAVKYFPLAFDMLGEKHRGYAAEFLFRNKTTVNESLNRRADAGLNQRKKMLQKIEAAIKADIPANNPGAGG